MSKWPDELTTTQAAAYLSERGFTARDGGPVQRLIIQKWCQSGDIPSRKIGRDIVIERAALDRCLPTPGTISRDLLFLATDTDQPVITQAEAARLAGVTPRRILYLVRNGFLKEPLTAAKVRAYYERPGYRRAGGRPPEEEE